MAKQYAKYQQIIPLFVFVALAITARAQLVRGDYLMGKALPMEGNISRADPEVWIPAQLLDFQAQSASGGILLTWQTGGEQNLRQFEVEYSKDNIRFKPAGIVLARNAAHGGKYRFEHIPVNKDNVFYRLKMISENGSITYTAPTGLYVTGMAKNTIPTIIKDRTVTMYLNEAYETVIITDMAGRVLRKQNLSGRTGRTDIVLPIAANGVCVLQLYHIDSRKNLVKKLLVG